MGNCLTLGSEPFLYPSSATSSFLSSSPKRRRLSISSLPFSDLSLAYEIGPHLGHGQFGVIRRCVDRSSGVAFACKSIPKFRLSSAQEVDEVLHEIDIMQHLTGHPHVVRLHHAFQDKAYVHLLMELCEGGELFDRITQKERYSEPEAAAVMKSLLETVKYCHSMGVMHRDLKPENILFADSSESSAIKLADFGLALRFSPGEKFTGMAGSAYYIAPEILQGQYSEEIDVWSAGVILYVLLSGMPPFWAETDQGILDAIKKAKLRFFGDPWSKISRSAKDLIQGMLCSDPKLRLTPTQVLEHPWILRHCQKVQTPEVPRAPPIHVDQGLFSSDSLCSGKDRDSQEISSCASCAPNLSCGTVLLDASEGLSSRCPEPQGSSVATAATPPIDPVHATSQTPSVSSFSPSILPQHVESGKRIPEQLSVCCPSTHDSSEQVAKSQSSNILHKSNASECDFNDFFVALINGLNRSPLSPSATFIPIRVKYGCTCTLMQTNAKEQTLLVEMTHGNFLIVHDKLRKRIGWKPLQKRTNCTTYSTDSQISRVSDNRTSFQQSLVVC